MIAYPARFTPEKDAINVSFPDLPEAITCGYSEQEAMEYAVDALETVMSECIRRRRDIPKPGKAKGKGVRLVALPALAEAKLRLYQAMRSQGVRKAELARRIGWHKSQMDRLLDLTHDSRLDQVETALKGLHLRLAVQVVSITTVATGD
jgi:antitoxin HicB